MTTYASPNIRAQSRDYFTADEVEIVREAQDIDLRITVLTHAIDRRFGILKIDVAGASRSQKESDKWGPLPEGTRLDLLTDIRRIMQKAIDDIDDTAAHAGTALQKIPENSTKNDKTPPLFPRAVRLLAAAAGRYKPALAAELPKTTDQKEKGAILDAIDSCDQVIDAVSKLPAAMPATPGKGH